MVHGFLISDILSNSSDETDANAKSPKKLSPKSHLTKKSKSAPLPQLVPNKNLNKLSVPQVPNLAKKLNKNLKNSINPCEKSFGQLNPKTFQISELVQSSPVADFKRTPDESPKSKISLENQPANAKKSKKSSNSDSKNSETSDKKESKTDISPLNALQNLTTRTFENESESEYQRHKSKPKKPNPSLPTNPANLNFNPSGITTQHFQNLMTSQLAMIQQQAQQQVQQIQAVQAAQAAQAVQAAQQQVQIQAQNGTNPLLNLQRNCNFENLISGNSKSLAISPKDEKLEPSLPPQMAILLNAMKNTQNPQQIIQQRLALQQIQNTQQKLQGASYEMPNSNQAHQQALNVAAAAHAVQNTPLNPGLLSNMNPGFLATMAAFSSASFNRRRRKSRTAFTTDQLAELEKKFQVQKYLTAVDKDNLANKLGLRSNQVITWFQNRRAKMKREDGETNASNGKTVVKSEKSEENVSENDSTFLNGNLNLNNFQSSSKTPDLNNLRLNPGMLNLTQQQANIQVRNTLNNLSNLHPFNQGPTIQNFLNSINPSLNSRVVNTPSEGPNSTQSYDKLPTLLGNFTEATTVESLNPNLDEDVEVESE